MLNNPEITKIELTGPGNQILVNSMPFKAVGIRVPAELANGKDGQGRNIVRAGTPVDFDPLNRQTPATAWAASADPDVESTMPRGVLVHDCPAYTAGEVYNAQAITEGGVVYEYLHDDVKALVDATPLVNPESKILMLTRD